MADYEELGEEWLSRMSQVAANWCEVNEYPLENLNNWEECVDNYVHERDLSELFDAMKKVDSAVGIGKWDTGSIDIFISHVNDEVERYLKHSPEGPHKKPIEDFIEYGRTQLYYSLANKKVFEKYI